MSKALLHGLPIVVVVVLIALIYRRAGKGPAPYRLSQPWTYQPILWAATDEPIPAGRHHLDRHGYAGSALNVGGGASGRW